MADQTIAENKATHTPGPWRKGEMCGGTISIEADNPGATVGRIHVYYNGNSSPSEANANLIAAAPDLLAACKAMLLDRTRDDHTSRIATAAVEKAEGAK